MGRIGWWRRLWRRPSARLRARLCARCGRRVPAGRGAWLTHNGKTRLVHLRREDCEPLVRGGQGMTDSEAQERVDAFVSLLGCGGLLAALIAVAYLGAMALQALINLLGRVLG